MTLNFKFNTALTALLLFCTSVIYPQTTFTLTGRIYNAENKEILPFAAVYNTDGYCISNEDGFFELRLKRPAKWIKVRYTGFKDDSLLLKEKQEQINIYLTPQPNLLKDVVITAKTGNFRYNLFFKAIESYFKTGIKEASCKSFYRTYTLLNGTKPAELFESFHNTTCNAQEVKNLKLKGGKFLLPRKKTFINLASTVLIEMFKPCENAQNIFPFSPLQCVTVLHLKNRYTIAIKNIIKTENDTLYHFTFQATDTIDSFSGELFYYKRQNRVGKIKLNATSIKNHPLYSVRDPEKDKISNLNYFIEIGYVLHKNKNLISYINYDMDFNLKTGIKTDTVRTNMKIVNFDYDKSFALPIYPEIDFKYDYEKVACFPYNAALFENNTFIKEGTNELLIRRLFDTIRCYNSTSLDESIVFLQKRFQRRDTEWLLDDDLITDDYIPEAHIRYGNNYSKSKKAQWDSVFAYTFIFLDHDCYDNSATFLTNGMLDYKYSFMRNKNDSIGREYFKLCLDNCHSLSINLREYLEKKYQKRCPLEEELRADYKKFADINVNETYMIHSAANSPNKLLTYPDTKARLLTNHKTTVR